MQWLIIFRTRWSIILSRLSTNWSKDRRPWKKFMFCYLNIDNILKRTDVYSKKKFTPLISNFFFNRMNIRKNELIDKKSTLKTTNFIKGASDYTKNWERFPKIYISPKLKIRLYCFQTKIQTYLLCKLMKGFFVTNWLSIRKNRIMQKKTAKTLNKLQWLWKT